MDRVILHCDCNSFYASVECIRRPRLWQVPMAVCGDPENRHGIILAKNEPAKKYGIVTAETVWSAQKKCPELVLVAPHHDLYARYSHQINQIYGQYTDRVEPFSIDESWLDVTGSQKLFGTGPQIADALRARVRKELGLTISVGVSFNKIFAKMGSDYKKPDATTVITRENYTSLLYPLPVEDMIFVGQTTAQLLRKKAGIETIGQLAATPRERLQRILGKAGGIIWDYAHGLEDGPVAVEGAREAAKSVSNSITFRRNLEGLEDISQGLLMLADSVAGRLRAQGFRAYTVGVGIKDPSLKVITRQRTLTEPTDETRTLYETALSLVRENWNLRAPIRLLTVSATSLVQGNGMRQLSLFDDDKARDGKRRRLDQTVDDIRRRFGSDAVEYASLLHSDIVSDQEEEELPE